MPEVVVIGIVHFRIAARPSLNAGLGRRQGDWAWAQRGRCAGGRPPSVAAEATLTTDTGGVELSKCDRHIVARHTTDPDLVKIILITVQIQRDIDSGAVGAEPLVGHVLVESHRVRSRQVEDGNVLGAWHGRGRPNLRPPETTRRPYSIHGARAGGRELNVKW